MPSLLTNPSPVLALRFVVGAERQRRTAGPPKREPRVEPRVDTAEAAIEVGDPARRRRSRFPQREELPHLPRSTVPRDPQIGVAAEALLDRHAALQLRDGLARVEADRRGVRLPRIGFPLRAREAERVLRLRLVQRVADHRDRRVGRRRDLQLDVDEIARRDAVIAIAVGREMVARDDVVGRPIASLELGDAIPGPVAAADQLAPTPAAASGRPR